MAFVNALDRRFGADDELGRLGPTAISPPAALTSTQLDPVLHKDEDNDDFEYVPGPSPDPRKAKPRGTGERRDRSEIARKMQAFYEPAWFGQQTNYDPSHNVAFRRRVLSGLPEDMQDRFGPGIYNPHPGPGEDEPLPATMGGFRYAAPSYAFSEQERQQRIDEAKANGAPDALIEHIIRNMDQMELDAPAYEQSYRQAMNKVAAFNPQPLGMANLGRYGVGQLQNYGMGGLGQYQPLASLRDEGYRG